MSVIDAKELFIAGGTISRWQPGQPYTLADMDAILDHARAGRPFFLNGSVVSHHSVMQSKVCDIGMIIAAGALRRAVEVLP